MTDAPKRIWAWVDEVVGVIGTPWRPKDLPIGVLPGPNAITFVAEYIRADLTPPLEQLRRWEHEASVTSEFFGESMEMLQEIRALIAKMENHND